MLVYNTQNFVLLRAVTSLKRKLKGKFVKFNNFEFETLQLAKTLVEESCECRILEKWRRLFFVMGA